MALTTVARRIGIAVGSAGVAASFVAVACSFDLPRPSDPPRDAGPNGQVISDAGTDGPSRYVATVLEDRPVAYYRLGGTTLEIAGRDEVSKRVGTLVGNVEFGHRGAIEGDPDLAIWVDDGYLAFGDVFDFAGMSVFSV